MNEDKIIVGEKTFTLKSHVDLTNELERQYPRGLTITLENESLSNLDRYAERKVEDWDVLRGMIENGNARMAKAHGTLEAKLILPVSKYGMLEACDDTYYMFELVDAGIETEYNATTVMLGTETSLQGARVQVSISKDMIPQVLDCLYIEDIPFKEVMDMVYEYDVKDEDELMRGLDYRNFASMPIWKQEMIKEQTKEPLAAHYAENVKPAWTLARSMVNETLDRAAKEYGYESGADYKRDIQWTKNPSPEMVRRFQEITERHTALYEPYNRQLAEELNKYEKLQDTLRKQLARSFDRQVGALISDVCVIHRGHDGYAIRCKLGGVQQLARDMDKSDVKTILNANDMGETINQMAAKYFRNEILDSLKQTQSRGLHR